MKVIYLKDNIKYLKEVTNWLYSQWGYHDPESNQKDWYNRIKNDLFNEDLLPVRFLGLIDKKPVGTASLVKNDMNTHQDLSPWLADVYVKTEDRNKGYGSILVKQVIKEAKALKYKKIYLFTPDKRSFYKNLGWQMFSNENYRNETVDIMFHKLTEEGK